MPPPAPRTRFAPSPTGELHLGNLRTALFNALYARGGGGCFVLRIEDTDVERSTQAYVEAIERDLRWLGLDWDEGPGVEGRYGPYHQSERGELYRIYFGRLFEADRSYPCFCDAAALERVRRAQLAHGEPPRYPGTCARLSAEEVQRRLDAGETPAMRFRVPRGRSVTFADAVRGEQRFDTDAIGDFVIRRADGTPAFFFSNAVDDALMEVTHVLRGEDHLANTPRQLLLLEALGLAAPVYGHLPLIVDAAGEPLAKREHAPSARTLREAGVLPLGLANHLARLGHAFPEDELMSLEALARAFDLRRVGRAPARHDPARLRRWQKRAVEATDASTLWAWMRAAVTEGGRRVDELIDAPRALPFAEAVRENVESPQDAARLAGRLFVDPPGYDPDAVAAIRAAGPGLFEAALAHLGSGQADFRDWARAVGRASGVEGRRLFMGLRAALTGLTHGPELARLWSLWDEAAIRRRLQAAQELAGAPSA